MSLYQLSLEGTTPNANLPRLIDTLCGHCSTAQSPFRMREAVYQLETKDATKGTQKELKARCYLDTPGKPVWTVRQSDKQVHNSTFPADVKTWREVVVSEDIETFMEMLGFKFMYEYMKVGTRAVAKLEKSRAEILITKAKRLQERGDINSGVDIDASRYFVEITSASLEKDIQTFAQELYSFGTQLFPLVEMRKS